MTTDADESTINVNQPDELTSLKAKADLLGITYHPSIGVDKLRLKIENKLSDSPVPDEDLEDGQDSDELTPEEQAAEQEAPVVSSIPKPTEQAAQTPAPAAPTPPVVEEAPVVKAKEAPVVTRELTPQEKVNAARAAAREEAMKMVRINVTCMNPLKKEWPGEIITVGNNLVGTVSKFVPFDTVDGWHVPNIIYLFLKERQFQQFSAKKVPKGHPSSRVTKLVREFSIEVLDPLTEKELAALKQRQLMAKNAQE